MKATSPPPSFTPVPTGLLRRTCACGHYTTGGGECEECRRKKEADSANDDSLRRAAVNSEPVSEVPPIVYDVLRSPGQPLAAAARAFMEPRFGHDFSHVRVHTDEKAAQSASAVNALAYTVGGDIAFESGQYATGAAAGKKLLAHELAHVVQQGDRLPAPQLHLKVSEAGDRFEQEADRVANAVMKEGLGLRQQIAGVGGPSNIDEEEAAVSQNLRGESGISSETLTAMAGESNGITLHRTPVLQRTASFAAGAVHAVNNVAVQVATGGPAGQTWMSLNGTNLVTAADARAAIKPPTTTGQSTPTGVECWVGSVANNVGSFDETVLNSGPWSTVTPKANVGARLGLAACSGGAGNATLTANGKPSDADVAAANRTHEDHHAADDKTVFNSTILNWDNLLTTAKKSNQKFNGADVTACEAALFGSMGGTSESIAVNYRQGCLDAGDAFHRTPAGGPLRASNPASDAACGTATIEVRQ